MLGLLQAAPNVDCPLFTGNRRVGREYKLSDKMHRGRGIVGRAPAPALGMVAPPRSSPPPLSGAQEVADAALNQVRVAVKHRYGHSATLCVFPVVAIQHRPQRKHIPG